MKRIIVLLSMMLSMIAIDAMAQQVRGIETKRVVYNGEEYSYGYSYRQYSDEYYGWEFTNRNSIPVSVSIILKRIGDPDYIVTTKEIVLNSKESYIFKPYTLVFTDSFRVHASTGSPSISNYYVVYEAYKLE